MDRGFDAGVAVVPDTNGSVNENVDMDVNARVRRETSPAVVPIGRGEPPVAGVRTGEGEQSGDLQLLLMILTLCAFCVGLCVAKSC